MTGTRQRAVFLDRDGTLIENLHYGYRPHEIRFAPGVVQGLRRLQEQGFLLVVVTNQSGIARAFFTEEQLARMNSHLVTMLREEGITIAGVYYCPHHPEGVVTHYAIQCDCRKPSPGMILAACSHLGVDPAQSWMVGDILDDVEAGHRAGCRSILVDVGTEGPPETEARTPEYVAEDFSNAVTYLLEAEASNPAPRETAVG